MKRPYKWLMLLIAVVIGLSCLSGCEKQPAETTAETVGEAVNDTGNGTSDETLATEEPEKEQFTDSHQQSASDDVAKDIFD